VPRLSVVIERCVWFHIDPFDAEWDIRSACDKSKFSSGRFFHPGIPKRKLIKRRANGRWPDVAGRSHTIVGEVKAVVCITRVTTVTIEIEY
jgi:hypothetical protein